MLGDSLCSVWRIPFHGWFVLSAWVDVLRCRFSGTGRSGPIRSWTVDLRNNPVSRACCARYYACESYGQLVRRIRHRTAVSSCLTSERCVGTKLTSYVRIMQCDTQQMYVRDSPPSSCRAACIAAIGCGYGDKHDASTRCTAVPTCDVKYGVGNADVRRVSAV